MTLPKAGDNFEGARYSHCHFDDGDAIANNRLGDEERIVSGTHPDGRHDPDIPDLAADFFFCHERARPLPQDNLKPMANLELVALIVREYDPAIRFFVDLLQFELVEDTPSLTNDGRAKRWVVVRPTGGQTGILLARADGEQQARLAGQQFAGRVGLFLGVEDFDATYQRMLRAGVRFVSAPRVETYGKIAVFLDLEGNRWDLLGPDPGSL
jgi:catechol 2,3-dioxygenase-like lactoylglutathione lyase family enzyme